MKKVYMMLAAAVIGTSAFAQRSSTQANVTLTKNAIVNSERTLPPYDTIGGPSWSNASAQPTIYNSTGGGYVCGNNGYGDKQKAEAFIVGNPMYVVGAMYWFAAKEYGSNNANSKITLKMYNMNGTGTNASSATAPAPNPNGLLASQDVTVALLDTGTSLSTGANIWMLNNPVSVSSDFALGFDMTGLAAGDTVGLVTSTDGDAGGADLAWEQWSDNTWHSFLDPNNWNLDLDMFILAIVDQNVGVTEFHNGLKMYQNSPNPFLGSSVINYELAKSSDDVNLYIMDLTGRTVKVIKEGQQEAGKHVIKLDANDYAPGQYIFSLQTNGSNLTKKMTVVH